MIHNGDYVTPASVDTLFKNFDADNNYPNCNAKCNASQGNTSNTRENLDEHETYLKAKECAVFELTESQTPQQLQLMLACLWPLLHSFMES